MKAADIMTTKVLTINSLATIADAIANFPEAELNWQNRCYRHYRRMLSIAMWQWE